MFQNMRLTGKIVGSIVVTLALTSGISFWITKQRVEDQAEEAFRDKVRQITGMAGATRAWYSSNIDTLVPGQNFKTLNQVPVVAAWSVAQAYANGHDMVFHTPSLTPRNPKNQPDDFERAALEAFAKDGSLKEFSERRTENGKEVMRYAQPVRASEDCLFCHGDPVGQKDPFGYTKEGLKVGDLRGAFAITASTEGLVQNARSNSIAIFLTSFFSLLAAACVVLFLVRKLVVKPLSASVELANNIASNNLAIADLVVESDDEIGEATTSLNQMKENLRQMIGRIAATADQLASASEEISAGAMQSAATAQTQSDQTRQVATAMHQMSATVLQVSESSQKASNSSHQAAQAAAREAMSSKRPWGRCGASPTPRTPLPCVLPNWERIRKKSARSSPLSMKSPIKPICLPSMRPSKPRGQANRDGVLRWLPMRYANWPNAPPKPPRKLRR